MELTKENYIIRRASVRKENNIVKFIKKHKTLIIVSVIFLGLILAEGILLTKFINLLVNI